MAERPTWYSDDANDEPRMPIRNFARQLRRTSTDAERRLWRALRHRQLRGFKFRRQHPVPPYVLDFYCVGLKLCIELDGGGHLDEKLRSHDQRRSAFLREKGIKVIRIANDEVMKDVDALVDHLWLRVTKRAGLAGAEGIDIEE